MGHADFYVETYDGQGQPQGNYGADNPYADAEDAFAFVREMVIPAGWTVEVQAVSETGASKTINTTPGPQGSA